MTESTAKTPRVLIVAEHASAKFGGEAILPLHYFRVLRKRGVEAWLIVHSRTREELSRLFPDDLDRIHFLPDTKYHRLLYHLGKPLPGQLRHFSVGFLSRLSSQRQAKRVARRLIAEHRIDVVHQPIPVSPKESSLLHGLGVPVVIGPMNGGMRFPPGFAASQGAVTSAFMRVGRMFSGLVNRLMPGKLRAQVLLVANDRTRLALPADVRGRVITLVENGVDLALWTAAERDGRPDAPVRFAFTGRLVDWKAVDVLLGAFAKVAEKNAARLDVMGDGPMRSQLQAQAKTLHLDGQVTFHGWVAQADCAARLREADALVLPSLYECGGAVVLEAMAMGLPVIATDWGGPADYLDATCGILVPPKSRGQFVEDLAAAMLKLAGSPELRAEMGRAGRRRVEETFDWERKADRILEIYGEVCSQS
ncbi:MAG TPA: glycosyltransferase family 4 protein [Tepidisphaeraceae bacterium]|nr:glycosyltransferase family 4 protein [Tepidisphaeraceae bacterium]